MGHTLLIPATIYGNDALMAVDTAAEIPMISQSFLDLLGPSNGTSYEQTGIKNAERGSCSAA